MKRLLLAAVLTLSACGGGNSSTVPDQPPPAPPAARAIDYTFFGESDTAITAPFTSVYHVVDWDGWGSVAAQQTAKLRMIGEMQQARARGVDRFILSTGFLTFGGVCDFVGTAALAQFKLQLDALDLSRSVVMLYPLDEPDVHHCTEATMTQAFKATRAAWGGNIRIAVIYGANGQTPGIDEATDVGRDNYGHGPQALNLRADQSLMLVAGGANPYREDIQQYVAYAQSHANVSLVWAFLYVAYTDPDGHPQQGIGTNGLLGSYCNAGRALTLRPGAC